MALTASEAREVLVASLEEGRALWYRRADEASAKRRTQTAQDARHCASMHGYLLRAVQGGRDLEEIERTLRRDLHQEVSTLTGVAHTTRTRNVGREVANLLHYCRRYLTPQD